MIITQKNANHSKGQEKEISLPFTPYFCAEKATRGAEHTTELTEKTKVHTVTTPL